MEPLTRRRLLQAGLVAGLLPRFLTPRPASGVDAPPIHSRAAWGADLPPKGPLEPERREDVRFLLVHHSVSVKDYPAGAVPEELRGFYRLHTAPEKGWADLAYNFLVDRFGGIWEGRAGSIEAPVKGDATGGSQGFALLCCFIGDHRRLAPSPEAQASMVALLAWLAERYAIDPRPGASTSFISRGSNRWPAGTPVTTTTLAGHRDMSRTVCPGDAAYDLVRNDFPTRVAAAMGTFAAAPTSSSTSPPTTSSVPTTPSAPTTTATTPPVTTTTLQASTTTSAAAPTSSSALEAGAPPQAARNNPWPLPLAAAAGTVAIALAIRRRGKPPAE